MIVRVSLKFDREGFNKRVESAVNAGITRAAIAGERFMKTGMGTGGRYTPSSPGSPPNVQRGHLRNSITHTTSTSFKASAGTRMRLGWVLETGNNGQPIRPKRTKFLPVPANVAAQRVMEQTGSLTTSREDFGNGGWVSSRSGGLRSVPNLTPIRTKSGGLMLIAKDQKRVKWNTGNGGWLAVKQQPAWFLVRQVRIPARPWCKPAVDRNKDAIATEAIAWASKAFSRGIQGGAAA